MSEHAFIQPLTENSSVQKDILGAIRTGPDGKMYKYVKCLNVTATVAGAAGTTAVYGLAGMAAATVVTDKTDSQTKPVGAGQLMVAVAGVPGTAEYVWVQVRGPATHASNLAGTPTDGDALFAGGADGVLTLATAADDPICAYADDESADLIMCAFPF